jgi:hypothetical protein
MKPAPLGALNADLAPIDEDLPARINAIFERCLSSSDVLRGRTFARSLH